MKKNLIYVLILIVFGTGSILTLNLTSNSHEKLRKLEPEENENYASPDRPDAAEDWYYSQRAYPLGYIPENWREKAMQHVNRFNKAAGVSSLSWTELGPDNIGGRVRAIAVHPSDPNIVYIGSVSGGVWKTTNGGGSWVPLKDKMENLAVCSIVLDPVDPKIIYAGTGEGFGNSDSRRGEGIFKSTDAGASWVRLTSTVNSNFYYVNRMVFDNVSHTLWVATKRGLYKSTDGSSFTNVLGNTDTYNAMDVDIAYTSPVSIFVTVGHLSQSTLYRSTDAGATFASNFTLTGAGRIEMAVSKSNPNISYISMMSSSKRSILYMGYTTDNGNTWSKIKTAGPSYNGDSTYVGFQGWYDNILTVDPADANTLFCGGIDVWKTSNHGTSWKQISNWYQTSGYQFIHADNHAIAFAPSNPDIIYVGNDGGIFKSTDRGLSFHDANNGLAITQFYYGAVAPTGTKYYGGTQDNGTLASNGTKTWFDILGGDGGATEVDYNHPNTIYMEYVYLAMFKTTDGGNTYNKVINGIPSNGGYWDGTNERCAFIAPFIIDPNDPNILLAGTYRLWRTTDGAANWTSASPDLTTGGTGSSGPTISTIAVANGASEVIFVGCSNGVIQRTTDAGTTWQKITTGLPTAYCSRIVIDPNNTDRVIATFSGFLDGQKVFASTNAGDTWTNISSNLPNIPVNCAFINPAAQDNIVIGTDLGIFESANNGGTWTQSNNGLANVAVVDLDFRSSDKKLFAATHGRGMFVTSVLTGINDGKLSEMKYQLNQNYPNPFNPETQITYT
ncbi:MAG: hypothetical protein Q8903_08565, partial [Bacteroidota bacterium]|nr:hypothetical protein [Bacteroidota bacterium]